MIDFTKNDDLNKIISDNDIAIIQYGTATCMPCHSITVEVYIEGRLSIQKSGYFSLDEILEKVSTVSEQMK